MKICSRCKQSKALSAFGAARREKDGVRSECRECRYSADARSAPQNAERAKRWYYANRARRRAYLDRPENRERYRLHSAAWEWKNPERKAAQRLAAYTKHKPAIIARLRAKFKADPQKKYAYMRVWLKAHPGYKSRHTKQWAARYPDRAQATSRNMYARRKAAPGEVTAKQWKQILFFYGNACAHCQSSASDVPLTVDHYIPIAKGGTNTWDNVWPLCMPCNNKKYVRLPTETHPPHVVLLREALG